MAAKEFLSKINIFNWKKGGKWRCVRIALCISAWKETRRYNIPTRIQLGTVMSICDASERCMNKTMMEIGQQPFDDDNWHGVISDNMVRIYKLEILIHTDISVGEHYELPAIECSPLHHIEWIVWFARNREMSEKAIHLLAPLLQPKRDRMCT